MHAHNTLNVRVNEYTRKQRKHLLAPLQPELPIRPESRFTVTRDVMPVEARRANPALRWVRMSRILEERGRGCLHVHGNQRHRTDSSLDSAVFMSTNRGSWKC